MRADPSVIETRDIADEGRIAANKEPLNKMPDNVIMTGGPDETKGSWIRGGAGFNSGHL
jgi:hypothetical protein